jgi:hypothetical protein
VHIGLRKSSVSVKDHKTVNQTAPIYIHIYTNHHEFI